MNTKKKGMLQKVACITLILIAVVYAYVLLKIVLFKYGFTSDLRGINLYPFQFVKMFFEDVSIDVALKNILGNIAIFIPLGIYVPMFNKKKAWIAGLWGFGLSLMFEVIQYILGCGAADIDDLILNTVGTYAGVAIYYLLLKKIDGKLQMHMATAIFLIIFGVAGRLSLYMFAPNMLPAQIEYVNQEVLNGIDEDSFDVDGTCIGIKDNTVLLREDSVVKNDENYTHIDMSECTLDENAVLIVQRMSYKFSPNGNIQKTFVTYSSTDMAELTSIVEDTESGFCDMWLNEQGNCTMFIYNIYED